MAYYLVRARVSDENVLLLREQLANDQFVKLQPFGRALTKGLSGMRRLPDGRVVWEEEDYCSPPLRMEREAVLDEFFTQIEVERVAEGEGWERVKDLPSAFVQA